MTILQAMVLGAVQGVTEFLPISSTAHLALLPYWLGWNLDREIVFLFGVLVQLGTLAAVAVYFFRDLKKDFRRIMEIAAKREAVRRSRREIGLDDRPRDGSGGRLRTGSEIES